MRYTVWGYVCPDQFACYQAKMVSSAKAKGGKEIPVPKVTLVPTYNIDYLPTFREQNTYIRGRGVPPHMGVGLHARHR
jgi:hypothetical protein